MALQIATATNNHLCSLPGGPNKWQGSARRKASLLRRERISSPSKSKEEDAEVSTSSSSDPGSDSDSEEEEDSPLSSPFPDDIVDVDFEFFDPKPHDFHGAKALLRTYLDDVTWDTNGFVELFLAQSTVGSVVKKSEAESPIGLISTLNLARYKDSPCMKHIQQYMDSKASGKPEAKQLERSPVNVVAFIFSNSD